MAETPVPGHHPGTARQIFRQQRASSFSGVLTEHYRRARPEALGFPSR